MGDVARQGDLDSGAELLGISGSRDLESTEEGGRDSFKKMNGDGEGG